MTNRAGKPNPVSEMIAALDGAEIPGGCDECDAFQVVHARAGHRDVHVIRVFHDDDCPVLAAIERARRS
jgi:hypothetical protein